MSTASHRHKRRRAGGGPAGVLWSCWCSCGWVCPDLTKTPHDRFQQHLKEVGHAMTERMMQQPPSGRG